MNQSKVERSQWGFERLKMLLVDDDQQQRNMQREIFSSMEMDVYEAADGREALEKLNAHDFDVMLLDKTMPVMNGYEVCHEVRQSMNLQLLPIIMVTGSEGIGELTQSLDAGATDFISKPYHPAELRARVLSAVRQKKKTDQLDHAESILFALARLVESKDSFTGQHCSRLVQNSHAFGEYLGMVDEDLEALRYGGVLHDIGKLAVPDHVLMKKGKLSESEWELMLQHPVVGARLCQDLNSIKHTIPIILHHHERWDGSGYPHGLKGKEIPLLARVFQLVDIFDALYFERPYKSAFSFERVIEIIRAEQKRGWRDPELTEAFLQFLTAHKSSLNLNEQVEWDLGNNIFQKIKDTGVLGNK